MESKTFFHFKSHGCCDYCSLRMTGITSCQAYMNVKETLISKGFHCDEDIEETPQKILKKNSCIACLGLLEISFCESVVSKVVEELERVEYDSSTFNMALTLPVACQLRTHSLWIELISSFSSTWKSLFPLGRVAVTVKDVLKWLIAPRIESATNRKFLSKSDFLISIEVTHEDNLSECNVLSEIMPDKFKGRNGREVSRKGVDEGLLGVAPDEFRALYPVPPSIPTSPAILANVNLCHASVYVGGRYRKLSRTLPQTPWVLNGERKMESSVQEYIAKPIEEAFKASGSKFVSSGREDVDVRMLGNGRPFIVEICDPKRPLGFVSDSSEGVVNGKQHEESNAFATWRKLEELVKEGSTGNVEVFRLQPIPKELVGQIKLGETLKRKQYTGLIMVVMSKEDLCSNDVLVSRAAAISLPLDLSQSTPVRVLHRRPLAVRTRTIHALHLDPVDRVPQHKTDDDDKVVEYFKMTVVTDAGTYVKEFVHGDLGRTSPSLAGLLSVESADILALDVTKIELDWPPPIDNKSS